MNEKAVVVMADMITAYGGGVDACWDNIMKGKTAVSALTRFKTTSFNSGCAAIIDGLKYHGQDSLVIQMLRPLLNKAKSAIPEDSKLILATTKGEVDLLENEMINGVRDTSGMTLLCLLKKVSTITGLEDGIIVSAACASSSVAVARAAVMIRSGQSDCVLVAACDSVTEFVYSGFSSLMALDKNADRPFDKDRNGLSLGDGAAFALIMSESRAKHEKREVMGEVVGWGMSDDANHVTAPCQDSEGMVMAVKKALKLAGIDEEGISFIAAHGTGTVYNDAMEIKAFKTVFKNAKKPLYSIKGGTGHTMGAAGLIEMIIAMKSLRYGLIPPTVNLKNADDDAIGWVSSNKCDIGENKMALQTSAGFGGVNAALVLA